MNPVVSTSTPKIALEAKQLTMQFGGLRAVSELNLVIPEGSISGLIGPNGAGKTTAFNMLTGVYEPTHGQIFAYGSQINGKKAFEVTSFGLARTFQNIRLFKDLSVLENIMIAMDQDVKRAHPGFWATLFRSKQMVALEEAQELEATELLGIFDLAKRKHWLAKNLPYGDQRRLEIARAMATGAKLLLLDEPAAGMNPNETAMLMDTIRLIRDRYHMTILLIEHDMKLVMGICERISVMDHGIKIAEGTPSEIQKNPAVIAAYLGSSTQASASHKSNDESNGGTHS